MKRRKKSSPKSAKIYKKSFTLLYRILVRLQNKLYPSQIARQLGISKQLCLYHIWRLEREKLIKREVKEAITIYSLTPKGNEFLQKIRQSKRFLLYVRKENIRNHNLAIKLKILTDNSQADFSKELDYREVLKGKKHWKAKVFVFPFPISATIEKNPEYIIVNFHKFYSSPQTFLNDFFLKVFKGISYVCDYFYQKYEIKLDRYEPEIIRFHLANERPDLNEKVKKKAQITVGLNRKAKVIFPTNFDAKAWLDRSQGNVEIETNDLTYEENLLMMPEAIHSIANLLPKFQQSIEMEIQNKQLHLSVLTDMKDTLKAIREELRK